MGHKVLVADDSLTIQKVIKITLSSEPFDLVFCNSDDELAVAMSDENPPIVLLDFNLSENKTGYELCELIKKQNPNAEILMLFGTFDNVDEEKLRDAGCNYHITKPFDGSKFINLCKTMAMEIDSHEDAFPSVISEGEPEEDDEDEAWVVHQPGDSSREESVSEWNNYEEETGPNLLESEIESWGMEVPSIIGAQDEGAEMEIPEVISEKKEAQQSERKLELTPLNELNLDQDQDFELTIEEEGTQSPEDLENIQKQIEDEVSDEDLWQADIYESGDDKSDSGIHHEEPSDQSDHSDQKVDEALALHTSSPPLDVESLKAELTEEIRPFLEQYIKQYCKEQVERIAWEIIPDLAENLIRKEIEKISQSIIDQE